MTATRAERRLPKLERRDRILLKLRLKPHVHTADLAAQFGVTAETIRRDVEDLSRAGRVSRAYGGASALLPGGRRDLDERRREHVAERERIGRAAATLAHEGEVLMIDARSTTIQLARLLAFLETKVTVVTNCVQIAMILGQAHAAKVILCPGSDLAEKGAERSKLRTAPASPLTPAQRRLGLQDAVMRLSRKQHEALFKELDLPRVMAQRVPVLAAAS